MAKAEVKAVFPVCQLLDVLDSETKRPERKKKATSTICPKAAALLGSQGRCLQHFRVPGKKFWKDPGGSGVEGRSGGSQDRVLDRVARSSSTMVYVENNQPSRVTWAWAC